MYETLSKLYYKDQVKYRTEYEKRISSYGTVKLPFNIKIYNYSLEFPTFYVNHPYLDFLHDSILKQSRLIQSIINKLPPIAIEQYVKSKLVDELLSTNEIEGVHSTKAEMETVLEIVVKKDAPKKKVRHLSLMNTYFNLFTEDTTKIESIEQIREIYDRLVSEEVKKEDELDGQIFRNGAVDVKTSTDKTVHRGLYPESKIHTHLNMLIDYLNNHNSPMLYKIAVAHYYFGYIHPFYDGNGRTSRYISSMYLTEELDKLTSLTLSYSTNKTKQLYYEAFNISNDINNKGELTYFCEAFFQIVHNAQNYVIEDLSKKFGIFNKLKEIIAEVDNLTKEEKEVLFVIGQHYIFGIEGTGISKKELGIVTEASDYSVGKIINKVSRD